MRLPLTVALVAALAVLSACAKQAPSGSNTSSGPPTSSVQKATVQTSQGQVVMGQGAVDPNSLGLPVYPGATPSEAGSYSMQAKQGSAQIITLETHDPYDKVVAFYKDKMPAGTTTFQTGSGAGATAQFIVGKDTDKSHKQIVIAQSGGLVRITMLVGTNM
jgi:hypothetical protein